MNVLKAIKSFFTIADDSSTSLSRKMKHSARPAQLSPEERADKDQFRNQYEKDAKRIHDAIHEITEEQEQSAIDYMKSKQVTATPLTENEIRYIAMNCDFPLNDDLGADPRLVQAINFAVNLHAVKVKHKVDEIMGKFETK